MNELFKNEIPILNQPELRHVLAHLYCAIDDLAEGKPLSAQDNIASIAGLIGMTDIDFENHYRKELKKWQRKKRKRKQP